MFYRGSQNEASEQGKDQCSQDAARECARGKLNASNDTLDKLDKLNALLS